jgi:electron-transferring-flavoprotein dehydrogenase
MKQRSRGARGGDTFIVSLGDLCAWMGEQAALLGVEVLAGFGADEVLFVDEAHAAVAGVATKDTGRGKDGKPRSPNVGIQRGVELRAPFTLFAEGCRGHLTEQVVARFGLARGIQTYGLGLKELWRVAPDRHTPGLVAHTVGWPSDASTWAGSFEYHANDGLVHLGYTVGLDYSNPYIDPFMEFQKFKTDARIVHMLQGAECLGFGARTIADGGVQAVPRLSFPGGALAGCGASFMNVSRLKGAHTAMKTGMIAAEVAFAASVRGDGNLDDYERRVKQSWVWRELYRFRNMKPSFNQFGKLLGGRGLLPFLGFSALDAYLFRGKLPWTFSHGGVEDHDRTKPAIFATPKKYPVPNGVTTFDRTKSLSLSGVSHIEDQPSHLVLRDPQIPVRVNHAKYAAIDQRYCPAGVYEYHEINGTANPGDPKGDKATHAIHAASCLHCKSCSIKDPTQNVKWTLPEGAGGPNYSGL